MINIGLGFEDLFSSVCENEDKVRIGSEDEDDKIFWKKLTFYLLRRKKKKRIDNWLEYQFVLAKQKKNKKIRERKTLSDKKRKMYLKELKIGEKEGMIISHKNI